MTALCLHSSAKRRTPGQQDKCPLCFLDIICNKNGKWVWLLSIGPIEKRALMQTYALDRITNKTDD